MTLSNKEFASLCDIFMQQTSKEYEVASTAASCSLNPEDDWQMAVTQGKALGGFVGALAQLAIYSVGKSLPENWGGAFSRKKLADLDENNTTSANFLNQHPLSC
jgi:hypothetical protein